MDFILSILYMTFRLKLKPLFIFNCLCVCRTKGGKRSFKEKYSSKKIFFVLLVESVTVCQPTQRKQSKLDLVYYKAGYRLNKMDVLDIWLDQVGYYAWWVAPQDTGGLGRTSSFPEFKVSNNLKIPPIRFYGTTSSYGNICNNLQRFIHM